MSPEEPQRPVSHGEVPSAEDEEEAARRLFYETLEANGQLIDVDANTDIEALPPHVTWVRYPDGTVERRGFDM